MPPIQSYYLQHPLTQEQQEAMCEIHSTLAGAIAQTRDSFLFFPSLLATLATKISTLMHKGDVLREAHPMSNLIYLCLHNEVRSNFNTILATTIVGSRAIREFVDELEKREDNLAFARDLEHFLGADRAQCVAWLEKREFEELVRYCVALTPTHLPDHCNCN